MADLGRQWNGTEGTIIQNDRGYEIITEQAGESGFAEKPGSGIRRAHVRILDT
jgi:hypothetical protein